MEFYMKKAAIILFSLIISLLTLCMAVNAERDGGYEFIITEKDGEYTVSQRNAGTTEVLAKGKFDEIIKSIKSDNPNTRVIIDGVSASSSFEFPKGTYTLFGSMTLTGDAIFSVPLGTSLTFSDFTLDFDEKSQGYVRIKGGELTLNGGKINGASGGAFLLDYSSKSLLNILNADISSSSANATVDVHTGALNICGGSVKNTMGVAVNNDSSLSVGGNANIIGLEYDVVTEKPLSLACDGDSYCGGEISVKYLSLFEKGTLTNVFYDVESSALKGEIKLFDKTGRECELTYFEENGQEKNLLCVYLPFAVKLYDGGDAPKTVYKLKGEMLEEPRGEVRLGYELDGWYSESEGYNKFDFENPITDDVSIYAVYNLLPPSFSASSHSAVYDGNEHLIAINTLSHPLEAMGGFFTYEWYKGDKLVSKESDLRVKSAMDSGIYSAVVTFHYSKDSVSVTVNEINVLIQKAIVKVPEIPTVSYTGEALSPDIKESPLYDFERVTHTNVGVFPVEFRLRDTENYAWDGVDTDVAVSSFEITKASNAWIEEIEVSDIYYGAEVLASAKSRFGNVEFLYSNSPDGAYTSLPPSEVGSYFAVAFVRENANYFGIESEPIGFNILAERATSLTIKSMPSNNEYRAFDKFVGQGLLVEALYNSGRVETIGIDKISVAYQNGDSFRYGDNAVVLSYAGLSIKMPVSVLRAEYDIDYSRFEDITVTYNGKYNSFSVEDMDIVGLDGLKLRAVCEGGGCEVGSYGVKVIFYTDSLNYSVPAAINLILTVEPLTVELVWSNCEFVFDGTAKAPVASFTDAFGISRKVRVLGAMIDAGGDYTATAEQYSENYLFENPTVDFLIKRADYDFSKVRWSASSFIYGGGVKSVEISGLPLGVRVVGYTDASATNAGNYTAVASVIWDEKNYNPPPRLAHSWVIYPAQYDMSGFSVVSSEFVYDGNIHYPEIIGLSPVGEDGIALSYSLSDGATNVSEGRVAVTVSFHTESKNYLTPDSYTVYVSIQPRGIIANWQVFEYVYDENPHAPKASAYECDLSVIGEQICAGAHVAKAKSNDSNYFVINDSCEFVIKKRENAWTALPSVSDIFYGKILTPSGSVLSGEVIFRYFYDLECTEPLEVPSEVGRYYMLAESLGDENHFPISYQPIAFEIIEVVPTSIEITLLRDDFVAYENLSPEDFICTVYNNDGSEITADFNEVTVVYENGDSFRCSDSTVKFIYDGIIGNAEVKISKADYDMSGVLWNNTTQVYDGTGKSPTLSSLPNGVSVKEYVGAEKVNAGAYTVSAILEYDSENFNPPKLLPCDFLIEKAIVDIPELADKIYNGKPQLPDISASAQYTFEAYSMKNAGEYTLILTIRDFTNFCFTDGSDKCMVSFKILPIALNVTVSDYDLYLWEKFLGAEYVISGNIIDGDSVELIQFISGDMIYCKSANKNYDITVTAGRINRLGYPSEDTVERLCFIGLSILLFILLLLTLISARKRIRGFFDILGCKIKNRGGVDFLFDGNSEPEIPTAIIPTAEKIEENEDKSPIDKKTCVDVGASLVIDSDRADELITDSLAKDLLKRGKEAIYTSGSGKSIINVDTLSQHFLSGDRVDVNVLKSKGLVPFDTAYLKVLARGMIDKPLSVYANEFSLSAIKMIALTGGEAIKVVTVKERDGKK